MAPEIAIVGGGIGGLSAALFLRKAGFSATVFEAVPQMRELGAGIVVPPNMVRPLNSLGLSVKLQRSAVRLDAAWEFRRWQDGRVLFSQPMGERCCDLYGAHCYVAHRADLMSMLMEEIRDEQLQLNHRCTSISENPDGVEITFEMDKGKTIRKKFDVIIGADGIHSVIRPHVTEADEARFSGLSAFRCLVPANMAPEFALRPVQTLWLGPGRHFVHYPISGGKLINIVAIVPADEWRTESWTTEGDITDLAQEFSGWDSRLHDMISAAQDTKRWALYDRALLRCWSTHRVALLGDAAHAMLPFFAQGAAQAIEDSVVLANCLKSCIKDSSQRAISGALARYESIRRPRASEVQLMSRGREIRNHFPDGPEQIQRDRELARGDPLKQSAWLYGHDVLTEG